MLVLPIFLRLRASVLCHQGLSEESYLITAATVNPEDSIDSTFESYHWGIPALFTSVPLGLVSFVEVGFE